MRSAVAFFAIVYTHTAGWLSYLHSFPSTRSPLPRPSTIDYLPLAPHTPKKITMSSVQSQNTVLTITQALSTEGPSTTYSPMRSAEPWLGQASDWDLKPLDEEVQTNALSPPEVSSLSTDATAH